MPLDDSLLDRISKDLAWRGWAYASDVEVLLCEIARLEQLREQNLERLAWGMTRLEACKAEN